MSIIKRVKGYISNVGLFRGLGLAAYRWLGKTLSPGANLTWGDLGEDALLWFYIREVLVIDGPGFYVDVGCNDPVYFSNTYRLYQAGWRGIAIDADADVTREYERVRPRDQVVTALVSDRPEAMEFHVFEGTVISTVDPDQLAAWKGSGRKVTETRSLLPKTLDAILEEQRAPLEFELLKVDVEGHDAAVLRSIDLGKYRPRMIIVEMHHETIENIPRGEIYERLKGFDYEMVSLAGYNGIFIRRGN